MTITRRIFISSPADKHLDADRLGVKWAIIRGIRQDGYQTEAFGADKGDGGEADDMGWSIEKVESVISRCMGAVVLGLAIGKGKVTDKGKLQSVSIGSEYCHYEAALATAQGLPVLSILEKGIREKGFFNQYGGRRIYTIPAKPDEKCVNEAGFQAYLDRWKRLLARRSDIFLGYSSLAKETAQKVRNYLEADLKVSVLDWADGLQFGESILVEIGKAAKNCSAGVFLFTNDDKLDPAGGGDVAAPRDNVVLETGFFAHAKGPGRVLIIREDGSKYPTDLGGYKYARLADREDVASVWPDINRFVNGL